MALRDQLRVMVVDDMSTSRGLLVQALEAFGIKSVSHAPDGATALQAISKSPVHLVISDFNMPNMDGLQLLQALRSNAKTKGTGFILITGRAERQIIESGKKTRNEQLHQKAVRTGGFEEVHRGGRRSPLI